MAKPSTRSQRPEPSGRVGSKGGEHGRLAAALAAPERDADAQGVRKGAKPEPVGAAVVSLPGSQIGTQVGVHGGQRADYWHRYRLPDGSVDWQRWAIEHDEAPDGRGE